MRPPFTYWTRWKIAAVLVPVVVLALAGAIAYTVWERERRDIEALMQADFDTRVREAVGIFRERMLAYEQVLHSINGLFASSGTVERGEFQTFVGNLRIESHPGLQGEGYSQVVPAGELAAHVARIRAQGFPAYALRPAPDPARPQPYYTSAVYFEPSAAAFLSTLGSDYFAEPSRRHALIESRDSGGIAISNKIKLPGEDAKTIQAGFRMVLPVYRNGRPRDTVEARRANIQGWIFAAFSMEGLTGNIMGERRDIDIEVFDGGDALDEAQLFDMKQDRVGGESAVRLFFAARKVEVGGYTWTVTARSLPNFTTPIAISKLQLIARVGITASVLAALFAWFLLRRRIRSLAAAAELREAKERAEAANQAKSKFLAAASHDLRQPTHALSLFIATLRSLGKRGDVRGAEVSAIAERLQMALDGLGRLLNGLLDVSRLDAGAVEVHARPVAVASLLAEAANAFAGPAAAKGLSLRVARTSLWVHTDPVVAARVLSNLVANAVRYTEQGGILLGARRRGGQVAIDVVDTGIGIAPDQAARVFEEFYQVGNVARDREQGLGLGLAIVQRSLSLLGGEIRLDSVPGKGSRFSVRLPRADAVAPVAAAGPAAPSRKRRVLVIDDHPEVLDSMRALLEEWGHDVATARTVDEAVATAASHAFDLVLSDFRLADGIDGATAIRRVQAALGRPVAAALITGDTSPARIREARDSGFRLLHKPVDLDQLAAVLAG